MASKQDLRQSQAKTQDFRQLGTVAGADLGVITDRVNTELNSPLKLSATFPTADSRLNFEPSFIQTADGANKSAPPVKSQIHPLPPSSIDFQTQTITGATFLITWPEVSTVGFYRRAGFTLLGSGEIQVLFSDEAETKATLPNAGTLFVKTGTALGYVELQATDAAGLFKTADSPSNVIENSGVFRFGTGSGGAGAGDANNFTENLKQRLVSSYYEFVTPNVFEIDEKKLIDNATATFNLVDGVYLFTDPGQQITSINMFDTEFLESDKDSMQVELHAEWFDAESRDDAAVYELAINGSDFETINMLRHGLTNTFTGSKLLSVPTLSIVASQAGGAVDTQLNNTSLQALSVPIILENKVAVREVNIEIDRVGNPGGSYIINLKKDNNGVPGETIYSKMFSVHSLSSGLNLIRLSDFRHILGIGTYHLVIETDSVYKNSFVSGTNAIRVKTGLSGNDLIHDGTAWIAGTVDVKYSLTGHPLDLRVRVTSSAGGKKLKAYGIFYAESVGDVITGYNNLQKITFSGDDNVTKILVDRFLPDPDHLKIYDVSTGQVYRFPAFSVDGHYVIFPQDTFKVPSTTVELICDQVVGGGYDNSPANANLLAANGLGSTDPTADKSGIGRGPLLRNKAGKLRRIYLDEFDNIMIEPLE